MAKLSKLAGAASEHIAFVGQCDRVVLATIDLDHFFFVIICVEVMRLNERLDQAWTCLILNSTVAQLTKCSVPEPVDSSTLEQDQRVVPASPDLDDPVFGLHGDVQLLLLLETDLLGTQVRDAFLWVRSIVVVTEASLAFFAASPSVHHKVIADSQRVETTCCYMSDVLVREEAY